MEDMTFKSPNHGESVLMERMICQHRVLQTYPRHPETKLGWVSELVIKTNSRFMNITDRLKPMLRAML